MNIARIVVAVPAMVACLTVWGCAAGEPRGEGSESARGARDFVFVFITTGPLRSPTAEQSREAMAGHFANMERLADAGELLIAGPYADPRPSPDHRGLFVIDQTDVEAGLALARTDPAAEMGVFVMTAHRFTTEAPLTELPRLEKEDEARRLADPAVPDEWQGRRFVLATAEYSDGLLEAAGEAEAVLIAGRLHGAGAGGGDLVLVWVDAEGVEGVVERLPEGDWGVWGWYGSGVVAELKS